MHFIKTSTTTSFPSSVLARPPRPVVLSGTRWTETPVHLPFIAF